MPWSLLRRSVVVLLAIVAIWGFTTAPVAAIDGPTTTDVQADDTNEFPEEVCTDVTGMVNDEVPYDQVIWVDDLPEDAQPLLQPSNLPGSSELPEDAQPPNIPYALLTPDILAAIAIGYVPNQCDVADPNDPPFDPREDDIDPDGGADVVEESENDTTLVIVNGTLNQSGDGPGVEALFESSPGQEGVYSPEVRINDGEKDYGIDSHVRHWEDGTIYTENDVIVIGDRYGAVVDCTGEECNLDLKGTPNLINLLGIPSIPSHSDDDPDDKADETGETSDDGQSGDTDEAGDDGTQERGPDTDGSGSTDTNDSKANADDDPVDTATPSGADDGATAAESETADNGADTDTSDQTETNADDAATDTASGSADEPAAEDTAQEAAVDGDGPGFGVIVAVLSVLLTSLLLAWRD